ncbi:ATP-binding protein [Streptomyces microflavus]|uniref:ATP-binding protein n=1 Tax=Streptomyces microflavus TaxID=1919 RepID=UPI003F4BB5FD
MFELSSQDRSAPGPPPEGRLFLDKGQQGSGAVVEDHLPGHAGGHQADASPVIGEPATDAALHGYLPGRDFRILLSVYDDVLCIEVAGTRSDSLPEKQEPAADSESGRGLLLVEALSVRWGTEHGPFPLRTVRAEAALTGSRLPRPGGPRPGEPGRGTAR